MHADISRILIHEQTIRSRVREMARQIAATYTPGGPGLTIVPILSGSIIFLADLIRELPLKMKIALVHVSTYPGRSTMAGESRTIHEPVGDIRGRHILVVDDILDTGGTLRRVQAMIRGFAPESIRTAVLLRKPSKAPADLSVEFVGFDIEDQFVVGYGLDFDDHYRNYPHIGVLHPELLR